MLKLTLDEGIVFDMLSILQLKAEKAETPEKRDKAAKAHFEMLLEIVDQISEENTKTVLESSEYKALLAANLATFDLVDIVRETSDGLAKDAYNANNERFVKKKALQQKFFGTEPSEIKTHE